MYIQHIIHIMQKGYIGHQSLEDQTLFGWNGCLTPFHFITQPLNLVLLDRQICTLSFFLFFGQIVTRTKSFVFFCIDCNQDSRPCKVEFTKIVFIFIQSMTMKYFDHIICISFFFFLFCIKNKWRLHTTYLKREVPLKAPKSLFLEHPKLLRSLIVATPLGISRAKFRVRLK